MVNGKVKRDHTHDYISGIILKYVVLFFILNLDLIYLLLSFTYTSSLNNWRDELLQIHDRAYIAHYTIMISFMYVCLLVCVCVFLFIWGLITEEELAAHFLENAKSL